MAGWLDAIWIVAYFISWYLTNFISWFISTFRTWQSSMRWMTSFLLLNKTIINFIDCVCFYKSVYVYCSLYLFCLILLAVSTVLSTTSSWLLCLLLFKHVIHTNSTAKAQGSPCSLCRPGNPWISKNILTYFWRCNVFWDLREIAYYSCYHTQEQRLFCTSDCWHCQNKADIEIF